MTTRKITVVLTEAEARTLLFALGNSINDGSDRDIFDGAPQKARACWRAHDKIRAALYGKRKTDG